MSGVPQILAVVAMGSRIDRDGLENEVTPNTYAGDNTGGRLSLFGDRLVKLRVELIGLKRVLMKL